MPPTTAITRPAAGSELRGVVRVEATFSGSGFDVATCSLGGTQLASDSAQPIAFDVDTARVPDGEHSLTVAVRYRSGGTSGPKRWAKATIQVRVANSPAPLVSITTNIASGAELRGAVVWTAQPSVPVSQVTFSIDGVQKWSESVAPFQFNGDPSGVLDTTTLADGSHTLSVRAIAADGSVAASVSRTVKVENAEVPPLPDPVGTALFVHDNTGDQAIPPDYGWDWGWLQEGNSSAQIIPDGLGPELPAIRATLPASSASMHVEGVKKWRTEEGQHLFFGLQFKLPTTWTNPNDHGWGAAIAQLYYQACVNHTWGLMAHADHVRFVLLSGEHKWTQTPNGNGIGVTREYNNDDAGAQGPSPRAIPPGRLLLGKRHTLIAEIVASYESTGGLTRIWHRIEGEANYTKTVEVLNIPTLQWGPCNNNVWVIPKGWVGDTSQKVGFYAGASSKVRVYDRGKFVIGTDFASVASRMP